MSECQNPAIEGFHVLLISFSPHTFNMPWEYSIYYATHLSCRAAPETTERSLRHPFLDN